MIDQIFADIMKEARSREGKDLIANILIVSSEIAVRLLAATEAIRDNERREEHVRQDL